LPSSTAALYDLVENPSVFIKQDWKSYTPDDHEVWGMLYERRMKELRKNGSKIFLKGADTIGLKKETVPDLAEVNRRLAPPTGWEAVPVNGYIPAKAFFQCLSLRKFPTTVTIRKRDQLDYLPEPDILHDVFGHVPLHADPVFADFLQHYGQVAAAAENEEDITRMARLFWFTVEFGLIREDGQVKVYGSGLISSHGEAANALGPKCDRRPFSLDAVFNQHFEIDHFQDVLFVTESFDQLYKAVEEAGRRIGTIT
jgi:phenylalanine-4-hydroxylase